MPMYTRSGARTGAGAAGAQYGLGRNHAETSAQGTARMLTENRSMPEGGRNEGIGRQPLRDVTNGQDNPENVNGNLPAGSAADNTPPADNQRATTPEDPPLIQNTTNTEREIRQAIAEGQVIVMVERGVRHGETERRPICNLPEEPDIRPPRDAFNRRQGNQETRTTTDISCNPISTMEMIRPPISKMTKPATLSLDLEMETERQKDHVLQFRIECMDYFRFYNLPEEQWMTHAYHWMGGRLRRLYTQKYAKKGDHMTWAELLEFLDEVTHSSEKT